MAAVRGAPFCCEWAAIVTLVDVPAVNRACSRCLLRGEPSLSWSPARLPARCCLVWPPPMTTDERDGQRSWHLWTWTNLPLSLSWQWRGILFGWTSTCCWLAWQSFSSALVESKLRKQTEVQLLRQSSWACSTTAAPRVAPTESLHFRRYQTEARHWWCMREYAGRAADVSPQVTHLKGMNRDVFARAVWRHAFKVPPSSPAGNWSYSHNT